MRRHLFAAWVLAVLVTIGVASSAAAETTLLAEWLINGVAVTSSTSVEGTGEFIMEDAKAGIGVICAGSAVGTVGPDGAGETTEILTLGGVIISLATPLLCKSHKSCEESATDIEAAPEHLPLSGALELTQAGGFRAFAIASADYFVSCLVLGIKVSEECTTTNVSYQVVNVTGGVESVGKGEPAANCTVGGVESGELEFAPGNLLKPTAGGTLSVSSE